MTNSTQITIGLPRALLYHKYAPMWMCFFRALGCRVITSPETNRQILDQGIRHSIDENCLAVKIYLGHIDYLIGKVDYIFIPRIVSLYPQEQLCVKLFALADIVRNTFDNVPILEYTVDVAHNMHEWIGLFKIGLKLNPNPVKVIEAYRESVNSLAVKKKALLENQQHVVNSLSETTTRVMLVAHPYITYDALLGKSVVQFLEEQGVEILYADGVDECKSRTLSKNISTDLYWSYNKELLGAVEYYKGSYDGIIFLMAFPCGPDSLVINLCQHRLADIPLCILVMDELQSDAGLKTRLESFVDILRFNKERQP